VSAPSASLNLKGHLSRRGSLQVDLYVLIVVAEFNVLAA
jgi:hypothetical protein